MKSALSLLVAFILLASPFVSAQTQNGDVNCDEAVNILDITRLIAFLYQGGAEPCEIASSGVAYVHHDEVIIDLDSYFTGLAYLSIDAPDDGYIEVSFSLFASTETYCTEFLISEVRKDTDIITPSYISAYTMDTPISWTQIFPISSGMNYIGLAARSCSVRNDESNTDKAMYSVTFDNVNFSAVYHPYNYGTPPDKK